MGLFPSPLPLGHIFCSPRKHGKRGRFRFYIRSELRMRALISFLKRVVRHTRSSSLPFELGAHITTIKMARKTARKEAPTPMLFKAERGRLKVNCIYLERNGGSSRSAKSTRSCFLLILCCRRSILV